MENFDTIEIPQALRDSLKRINFNTPTPIQAQAIPPALEGKDILGSAQTGTGKTGAFGIPLVAKLLNNPRGSALVLCPTRELAVQVMEMIQSLVSSRSPIQCALIIGGESMPKQIQQLRTRPRVIVGTPGRINDHLERGTLMLHEASFLVLDETDRMLDMGFGIQLDKIFKFLPNERQTLMFSATLPANIVKISEKYLKNPVRVSVGSTTQPIAKITQVVIQLSEMEKGDRLLQEVAEREGSIIIFVKTKFGADKLATKLKKLGHRADAIHGDLRQNKRDRVIQQFRDSKTRILVATDIAARGLDIPHIAHVINHDLPQCPEDFIHRIGRTARAGAEGAAISLVTPADRIKWRAIQRLLDPNAPADDFRPAAGEGKARDYSKPRSRRPFKGKGFGNGGGNGGGRSENRGDGAKEGGFKPRREGGNGESRGAKPAGNGAPGGKKPFQRTKYKSFGPRAA